jgi:hypothetical protein
MIIKMRHPDTGEWLQFGRYDDAHCIRLTDMLPKGQLCNLLELTDDAPSRNITKLHKCGDRVELHRRIVVGFLTLIVDDLIDNGNYFQMPVQNLARWRIRGKTRKQVESIARRDTYKFVDLAKSDGMVYEMILEFEIMRRGVRKKVTRMIRLNYERYQRLCQRVETVGHYDKR